MLWMVVRADGGKANKSTVGAESRSFLIAIHRGGRGDDVCERSARGWSWARRGSVVLILMDVTIMSEGFPNGSWGCGCWCA